MRRLSGLMGVLVVLTALVTGCGSTGDSATGDDALTLQFIRFDNTGLTQVDSVRENSADIDVFRNCCLMGGGMDQMRTVEPFTQTIVNAVFSNREINDITINRYQVSVDNPASGLGDGPPLNLSATIIGGRCSNASDRHCAVDANCLTGGVIGNCEFSETTISSVLLFDFSSKADVSPAVDGKAVPIRVTFFGTDVSGNSFRAVAPYTVTFANFNNCNMGDTPVVCPE